MFLLLGAAADTAWSFLSSLQPTAASGASGSSDASQPSPFDPTASSTPAPSAPAPAARSTAPAMHSNDIMSALIAAQEQQQPQASQSDGSLSGREARLFGRIDTNGDGRIDKSEFEKLFGNLDPSVADAAFDKLDQNGDGGISQSEFAAARPGHHHHAASSSGTGDGGQTSSGSSGPTTTTTTNSDGSTTTTITYADGSKFTMTTPATASASEPGTSGAKGPGENLLQQLFNLQAQLSSAPSNAPTTAL